MVRRYLRDESATRYKPRPARVTKLDPFKDYVVDRLRTAAPKRIPASVLLRELRERGYTGGYTMLKALVASRSARASTRSTPSALPLVAADPGIYTGRAHPRYQDPFARRGGAGISTGRRTRQIRSVSSVAPVSSWSRQQAEETIRIATGTLFENRADSKLARMSVVMLHVKTVALISSPCLNGAISPQHTVVVLKCALNIEEFDHY
jgi:hypothetical protein